MRISDQNVVRQIITPFADIRSKCSTKSYLETEGLFGESFEVFKSSNTWSYGRLLSDNYYGYIENINLGRLKKPNYYVISPRANVNKKPDIKSEIVFTLSMGSRINIQEHNKEWSKIFLKNNEFGFIGSSQIKTLKSNCGDWVKNAEKLIFTPYKWGGKSAFGIDCSALVQLSLFMSIATFPRNSRDQMLFQNAMEVTKDKISRGCLVFWKGHVAIAIDKKNIIHANNFHKKVFHERLEDALKRNSNNNIPLLGIKKLIVNNI